MRCTHEHAGGVCWRSDEHGPDGHRYFPHRDDLVQLVGITLSNHEKQPAIETIVDDIVLEALAAYGDLSEQQRVSEIVTLASQTWMAAQRRQRDAIDRLLVGKRAAEQALADMEAQVLDLQRRYDALTSTTPASETDRG